MRELDSDEPGASFVAVAFQTTPSMEKLGQPAGDLVVHTV